jgi:hypothetical protein
MSLTSISSMRTCNVVKKQKNLAWTLVEREYSFLVCWKLAFWIAWRIEKTNYVRFVIIHTKIYWANIPSFLLVVKSRRRIHVHLFIYVVMKEGILYIREAIESSNLGCGGEDLLIVGALNLSISLGNKASFAALLVCLYV